MKKTALFSVIALFTVGFTPALADDLKDLQKMRCDLASKNAPEDFALLMKDDALLKLVTKEQDRQTKLLESIKPDLSKKDANSKSLQDDMKELEKQLADIEKRSKEAKDDFARKNILAEYKKKVQPIYDRINASLIDVYSKVNSSAVCPAGSTATWISDSEAPLHNGAYLCLNDKNADAEEDISTDTFAIYRDKNQYIDKASAIIHHDENLDKALSISLFTPTRLTMLTGMALKSGEIGEITAAGTKVADTSKMTYVLNLDNKTELEFTMENLTTENGKKDLQARYLATVLEAAGCEMKTIILEEKHEVDADQKKPEGSDKTAPKGKDEPPAKVTK